MRCLTYISLIMVFITHSYGMVQIGQIDDERRAIFNNRPTIGFEEGIPLTASIRDILKDKTRVNPIPCDIPEERERILKALMSSIIVHQERYLDGLALPDHGLTESDRHFKHFEILRITQELTYDLYRVGPRSRRMSNNYQLLEQYSRINKRTFINYFIETLQNHLDGIKTLGRNLPQEEGNINLFKQNNTDPVQKIKEMYNDEPILTKKRITRYMAHRYAMDPIDRAPIYASTPDETLIDDTWKTISIESPEAKNHLLIAAGNFLANGNLYNDELEGISSHITGNNLEELRGYLLALETLDQKKRLVSIESLKTNIERQIIHVTEVLGNLVDMAAKEGIYKDIKLSEERLKKINGIRESYSTRIRALRKVLTALGGDHNNIKLTDPEPTIKRTNGKQVDFAADVIDNERIAKRLAKDLTEEEAERLRQARAAERVRLAELQLKKENDQPDPNQWECSICNDPNNNAERNVCKSCRTPRPAQK